MPRLCSWLFVISAAAWCQVWLLAGDIAAQTSAEVEIGPIAVGLGGAYKVGYWTPVRVTLTASQPVRGRLELTALDGDGVPAVFSDGDTIELDARQNIVTRYVKFGRHPGGLEVAFVVDDQVVTRRIATAEELPPAQPSDREWIVTLGPALELTETLRETLVTPVEDFSDLPTDWYGYEGVNVVVVTTSDADQLDRWEASQVAALRRWVEQGGRVMLCVGANGERAIGQAGPLASLVPGAFSHVVTMRNLSPLETYVASTQAIDSIDVAGQPPELKLSLLAEPRGKLVVSESSAQGTRPIVIRAPLGFGQVLYVGVDLDQPPFTQWEGRRRLLERLIRGDTTISTERRPAREGGGQLVHLGYDDLIGQLRCALDQFTGVRLIPFSWVAALIVVYLVLLGPVDYFFLRDLLRRMHWTWVTFPLLAIIFCLVALVLHARSRAPGIKVNQVDVVDVDVGDGLVRGTTWAHVYSPRTDAYDLALRPQPAVKTGSGDESTLLSWQGLPGLENKAAALFATPYTIGRESSQTTVHQVPIPIDGTKIVTARWWQETSLASSADLRVNAEGLLQGSVVNPLEVELTDCMVMFENWVYRLERKGNVLQPGESTRVDLEQGLNLNWRLARRRVVDIRDVTTPWDKRDLDVSRILEVLLFHRAAGGDNYTQLHHRYQPYLDLSEHLTTGRAILFGRAAQSASDLTLDGQPVADRYDQRWTYYRIVFPAPRATSR